MQKHRKMQRYRNSELGIIRMGNLSKRIAYYKMYVISSSLNDKSK